MIPRLSTPTLVVAGSEAHGSLLRDEARWCMAAKLPPGRFLELDAGHSVHRDRFAEYCAALRARVSSGS